MVAATHRWQVERRDDDLIAVRTSHERVNAPMKERA